MVNGFILDEARRKMKSNTAYCVFLAVTLIVFGVLIFPFLMFGELPESNLIGIPFVMMYFFILVENTDHVMFTMRRTRQNYKNILHTADSTDRTDYENICLNVKSGRAFGGFYCGGDFLYSPYGILCKWEDIWKINVEFCRCSGFRYPYRSAVIRITLNSSEVIEGAVLGRKDSTVLADSLDSFEKYVKGRGTYIDIEYSGSFDSLFREEN